jgi:TPR repeat protein
MKMRKIFLFGGVLALSVGLSAVLFQSSSSSKPSILPLDNPQAAPIQVIMKNAEEGVASAQYNLGLMYFQGKQVPLDLEKANSWFQKSASQGLALGEYGLGSLLLQQDKPEEAVLWIQKAALQGLADAQAVLGVLYQKGHGVPLDHQLAMSWLLKAANQYNHHAARALGEIHESAQGRNPNLIEAWKWYQIGGDTESRDRISSMLTDDQLEQARSKAKAFRPTGNSIVSSGK